jgi:peptidoglycan-associated lipoprotein
MQTRGIRHIALAVVLCVGAVGCANKNGPGAAEGGYGASTSGAADGAAFMGVDDGGLMAQRKIYFDYDRSDLHEQDYAIIQAHAEFIKANPNCHVRIEGHTDENGSREYNIGLGERRADAVANALASQGVSRHQISTVSYGKEKPDADGHGEDCHRLNRRAVIVYEN